MKAKTLLFFAIFLFVALLSNAQVKQGRALLGGSISYYNGSNPKLNSFYSDVQFGKVIKNNSVVGIIGSYSTNNYNFTVTSPNKTTGYSVGFFYRKYKYLANNFYFFGELDGSYVHSKNIQRYYNNVSQNLDSKSNGVAISFIPGISYSVWKRMQVELSMPGIAYLGYSHVTTIAANLPPAVSPQKNDVFTAGANLNSNLLSNFGIGFKFLLGK